MLKIAGLAGLVISCGLVGMIKAWSLKERVILLEEFYKMILDMNSKINYFRQPLPELMAECAKSAEYKDRKNDDIRVIELINETLADINCKRGDMGQIWADNVTEIYADTPLTESDLDILSYVGTFMGQTDCENQGKQFEYMKNQLEMQINEAKEASRIKGPMYKRIGFFSGTIAALVLL